MEEAKEHFQDIVSNLVEIKVNFIRQKVEISGLPITFPFSLPVLLFAGLRNAETRRKGDQIDGRMEGESFACRLVGTT